MKHLMNNVEWRTLQTSAGPASASRTAPRPAPAHETTSPALEGGEITISLYPWPRQWIWTASRNDKVLGVVALTQDGPHVARVRRIRVTRDCPEITVGKQLVEAAVRHCRDAGYLKVIFEGELDLDWLDSMLTECGVEYGRRRVVDGRPRHEYYVNLYREPGVRSDGADISAPV